MNYKNHGSGNNERKMKHMFMFLNRVHNTQLFKNCFKIW